MKRLLHALWCWLGQTDGNLASDERSIWWQCQTCGRRLHLCTRSRWYEHD